MQDLVDIIRKIEREKTDRKKHPILPLSPTLHGEIIPKMTLEAKFLGLLRLERSPKGGRSDNTFPFSK